MEPSRVIFLLPLLAVASCAPGGIGSPNVNDAPPIHRKMLLLVEKFDAFDENGDGAISRAELEKAVNIMGPKPLTKEQYDRAMLVYDTDGDRQISRAEAKAAAAHGPVLFEN
jgi:hypothetical protein